MTSDEKIMKFTCEDGSEWSTQGVIKVESNNILVIKRVREVSELQAWINECAKNRKEFNMIEPTIEKAMEGGFLKAIEVIENIQLRKTQEFPHTFYTLVDLIAELKHFVAPPPSKV